MSQKPAMEIGDRDRELRSQIVNPESRTSGLVILPSARGAVNKRQQECTALSLQPAIGTRFAINRSLIDWFLKQGIIFATLFPKFSSPS